MRSPTVAALAPDLVAVLPIGAVEQHGPHLPVGTDTRIVTAIAERAEAALAERIVLCPTLPYGASDHHLSFAGTLSLGVESFTRIVVDLTRSLLHSGFRRILIINGHGGNIVPVKQALAVMATDLSIRAHIALATYWEVSAAAFSGAPPMASPALSHACEYETSMMLTLSPGDVAMAAAQPSGKPPANGYVGWHDDQPYRGVTVVCRTEYLSTNGSCGRPDLASLEKGEHLLDTAVDELVQLLQSFRTWPLPQDLRHA